MPLAVYALAAGAFGIGTTEFVIMGLLMQVSGDLGVSIPAAGLLISGYALGVFVGAPVLTIASRQLPRKTVLLALMGVFVVGNLACALAPDYGWLMAARVITSLAHGTFFGVGSVVATGLVPQERKASAIAVMFTGLTAATLLGVPAGAWLGLAFGWRSTFWAVVVIGLVAFAIIALAVPRDVASEPAPPLKRELASLKNPQLQLGFLMTVLGFAGVFAAFTYVQPLLTELTGFSEAAVSPILLVFGAGLAVGNLAGGRFADRNVGLALIGTLAALSLTLALTTVAAYDKIAMVAVLGALGAASFATVAPLQMRVMEKAGADGRNLASSLNIAAFNLGNAIGAWAGGATIDYGPGLWAVPLVAAAITLAGLAVAAFSLRLDRLRPAAAAACRT
ncbi:MFS transporter [Methylopila sp. 73B]|uniref:MFS transporter n=1 Tax=Methylopila sp. 73B TaxID=1120792 RepID=UPI000375B8BA|nr:MFS transporter [Methylopila sp. 73B]